MTLLRQNYTDDSLSRKLRKPGQMNIVAFHKRILGWPFVRVLHHDRGAGQSCEEQNKTPQTHASRGTLGRTALPRKLLKSNLPIPGVHGNGPIGLLGLGDAALRH